MMLCDGEIQDVNLMKCILTITLTNKQLNMPLFTWQRLSHFSSSTLCTLFFYVCVYVPQDEWINYHDWCVSCYMWSTYVNLPRITWCMWKICRLVRVRDDCFIDDEVISYKQQFNSHTSDTDNNVHCNDELIQCSFQWTQSTPTT